ncbi:MAG: hypothetical protein B6241_02740 [Spirochaetaceae bacterium 4572_59]|nr:MAG: hypothetical protein B6241_02740 [Spirochaetaceae bacterium 4572_59]
MKIEEFSNTIGYSGSSSIVDKGNLKKFGRLDVKSLLEKGLFKQAFSKALFESNVNEQELVLERYNAVCGSRYSSVEELKRLFGVFGVPEGISRTKLI